MSSLSFRAGVGHYVNILSSDWEPHEGELGLLTVMRPLLKTSKGLALQPTKPIFKSLRIYSPAVAMRRKWGNSLLADYLGRRPSLAAVFMQRG